MTLCGRIFIYGDPRDDRGSDRKACRKSCAIRRQTHNMQSISRKLSGSLWDIIRWSMDVPWKLRTTDQMERDPGPGAKNRNDCVAGGRSPYSSPIPVGSLVMENSIPDPAKSYREKKAWYRRENNGNILLCPKGLACGCRIKSEEGHFVKADDRGLLFNEKQRWSCSILII